MLGAETLNLQRPLHVLRARWLEAGRDLGRLPCRPRNLGGIEKGAIFVPLRAVQGGARPRYLSAAAILPRIYSEPGTRISPETKPGRAFCLHERTPKQEPPPSSRVIRNASRRGSARGSAKGDNPAAACARVPYSFQNRSPPPFQIALSDYRETLFVLLVCAILLSASRRELALSPTCLSRGKVVSISSGMRPFNGN